MTRPLRDPLTTGSWTAFWVRRLTTFRDSQAPPMWHRVSEHDTAEAARAAIAADRLASQKMASFVAQGTSRYIIQRRVHTVESVVEVLPNGRTKGLA